VGKISGNRLHLRVRRSLVVGAVVSIVVAAALIATALFAEFPAGSQTVSAGTAWRINSSAGYAVSVTIAWTGGVPTTHALLVDATPQCTNPNGVVASATGAQGTFHALLLPGHTYAILACNNQSWETATFTLLSQRVPQYTIPLLAAGGAMVLLAVVLFVFAARPAKYAPRIVPRRHFPHR
jgi:hypothetical protein